MKDTARGRAFFLLYLLDSIRHCLIIRDSVKTQHPSEALRLPELSPYQQCFFLLLVLTAATKVTMRLRGKKRKTSFNRKLFIILYSLQNRRLCKLIVQIFVWKYKIMCPVVPLLLRFYCVLFKRIVYSFCCYGLSIKTITKNVVWWHYEVAWDHGSFCLHYHCLWKSIWGDLYMQKSCYSMWWIQSWGSHTILNPPRTR